MCSSDLTGHTDNRHDCGYIIALSRSLAPGDAEVDTLGIQITANGRHKAVLLYDTEQSEVQLF